MCDTTMTFAFTAQKIKISVKDFFIKCDQISKFLWILFKLDERNPSWNTAFFV